MNHPNYAKHATPEQIANFLEMCSRRRLNDLDTLEDTFKAYLTEAANLIREHATDDSQHYGPTWKSHTYPALTPGYDLDNIPETWHNPNLHKLATLLQMHDIPCRLHHTGGGFEHLEISSTMRPFVIMIGNEGYGIDLAKTNAENDFMPEHVLNLLPDNFEPNYTIDAYKYLNIINRALPILI